MWQQIAIKALQLALCHFFQICVEQDECPDGVCDDALEAIDSLMDVPDPTVAAGRVQAFHFNIQWDQLECVVTSVRELVTCLRKFLGLDTENTVG
ncbi:MAG: hypothetical protein AAGJ40_02775 [Planctomycetota bacterium]